MGERVQINFRVDEEQKKDWEEYIDHTGKYSSLTGLIRTAVEKEINGSGEQQASVAPGLSADFQDLQTEIEEVRRDVAWLREQRQDEVDISDLAQLVFDELEPLPEPDSSVEVPEGVDTDAKTYRRKEAARSVILPTDTAEADQDGRNSQTAAAIADQIGSKESRVRDSVEYLQEQLLPIVEVEIDGQTHYFKEE
ncbi:hypothetical protein EXE41_17130 [Halorubrum sp. SD690R]|uniref:hypothetical protein n=1 Tax=Halorubrum sp. SD690R TaxID=2518117 RepID=UPI0010F69F23|nr:hypothetical protein [Halorubrum sp. SD690R]TKX42471.1 hypothetical protein EXE41_17130 [Halorubrum sp. SD690R]